MTRHAIRQDQDLVANQRTGDLIANIISAHLPTPISSGDQIEAELTLPRLADVALSDLQAIVPELDRRDYQRLLAAIELGRRVAESKALLGMPAPVLTSTTATITYCRDRFSRLATDGAAEEVHVLTLDCKNRVKNSHQVTVGVLDTSLVHPREVFRPAIKESASSIVVVHNHPSGDPTPSQQDVAVTQRLTVAGKLLGVPLLDHIIVAKQGVRSIREFENT